MQMCFDLHLGLSKLLSIVSEEMLDNRLWRPAAQRNVRNTWGYIQAQQAAWCTASANARSAATDLVNAYLSQCDVGAMDLGVLTDMDGIREKSRIKLRALQEKSLLQYLESYDALVNSVSEMRIMSASMRTYAKDSGRGPLIEFTKSALISGDTGDGGGVAVFGALPLCTFEVLARDLLSMFQKELRIKWLLVAEFRNLVYQTSETASLKGQRHSFGRADPVMSQENEADNASPEFLHWRSKSPSREHLQVYLTALLAEVHINKDRITEVLRLWSEEMSGGIASSRQR